LLVLPFSIGGACRLFPWPAALTLDGVGLEHGEVLALRGRDQITVRTAFTEPAGLLAPIVLPCCRPAVARTYRRGNARGRRVFRLRHGLTTTPGMVITPGTT